MFDDHWYHATTTQDPKPPPTLRRQDSLRAQSPATSALERAPVASKIKQRKSIPAPPKAEVPRRPKSQSDLRGNLRDDFILFSPNEVEATPNGCPQLPPRPKSRNDLDDLKASRYGIGRATKGHGRTVASISDELSFADWYGGFEDQLEDASNNEYRLFYSTLQSHLTTCNTLISNTDVTLGILSDLQGSFATVDTQTSSFQDSCSSLLSKHSRLQSLADSLATNLQPFTELEPITRVLSRPGSDFVKTPSFRDMLIRLDNCLSWMNDPAHRSFKDVETYAPRFRQCMTRALTLIRNYFVDNVKEVTNEVLRRIRERQMNDTTQSALLYAKFRVNAPLLRELVEEIEKRCVHEEYESLLNECYSCFASVRQRLVVPIITKRLQDLSSAGSSTSKDLVTFARSAISFVRSICLDEFELFFAYFSGERGDDEVYNFLETICEPLYDYLRPKVIHEMNLVKLCELCTLLQTRYMRDLEDPDLDVLDRSQLDFGQLIQSLLHDTQTRIVFRAQTVMRDEIENFTPKPEDLDYPAKSQRRASENSGNTNGHNHIEVPAPGTPRTPTPEPPRIVDRDDSSGGGMFDTEAMFSGWYPTLRKCIWLLSKIYRLVNSTVFDDLAHTIVHITTLSLTHASTLITTQRKSPSDGHLFLIKHLLLLKEQIVAFDIEFIKPDVNIDYSSMWAETTSTVGGIFSTSGLLKLIKNAAMPRVVENMFDAKIELDVRLRKVIDDHTTYWVDLMTNNIVGTSNKLANADAKDPSANVKRAVERELPNLRSKVQAYIYDYRTAEMLVADVMQRVMERYEQFYEEAFGSSGRRPRDMDAPWDADMFGEWCERTFDVGVGLLGSAGGMERDDDDGDDGEGSMALSRDGSV